ASIGASDAIFVRSDETGDNGFPQAEGRVDEQRLLVACERIDGGDDAGDDGHRVLARVRRSVGERATVLTGAPALGDCRGDVITTDADDRLELACERG